MVKECLKESRVLLLLVIPIAVLVVGCAHATVHVENDTGTYVRIASCVDDSADMQPGETFDAGGVTEDDRLYCTVAPNAENGRCVAIPNAHEIDGTFLLSRAIPVAQSKCEP